MAIDTLRVILICWIIDLMVPYFPNMYLYSKKIKKPPKSLECMETMSRYILHWLTSYLLISKWRLIDIRFYPLINQTPIQLPPSIRSCWSMLVGSYVRNHWFSPFIGLTIERVIKPWSRSCWQWFHKWFHPPLDFSQNINNSSSIIVIIIFYTRII